MSDASEYYRDLGAGSKAARIVADRRITEVDGRTFFVQGDHDAYIVVLAGEVGAAFCSCPATVTDCSHVRAAKRLVAYEAAKAQVPDDPFEGLT